MKVVNPLNIDNWNELILDKQKYSIFHSREWCKVLNKTYGFVPNYIANYDEGILKSLLPLMYVKSSLTGKRFVSLPFSDYCEPLTESKEEYNKLLSEVSALAEKFSAKYFELRGGASYLQNHGGYSNGYLHILKLKHSEEELLSKLRSSNKRNIKKAVKNGLEINFSSDAKSVTGFYKLNVLTRKRHGLPPQPFKFFKNIGEILMPDGFCEIAEAIYKNKVIASCVFLMFGKEVVYKFGASDYNFQNLRANDLLFWEALKRYSNLGYDNFCFGRTSAENKSLRQFKMGWGAAEVPSPYFRYNIKAKSFEENSKFSLHSPGEVGYHNYIFRYSPKPVLKLIGNLAYKHIG